MILTKVLIYVAVHMLKKKKKKKGSNKRQSIEIILFDK